jgi:hypothetical protein
MLQTPANVQPLPRKSFGGRKLGRKRVVGMEQARAKWMGGWIGPRTTGVGKYVLGDAPGTRGSEAVRGDALFPKNLLNEMGDDNLASDLA